MGRRRQAQRTKPVHTAAGAVILGGALLYVGSCLTRGLSDADRLAREQREFDRRLQVASSAGEAERQRQAAEEERRRRIEQHFTKDTHDDAGPGPGGGRPAPAPASPTFVRCCDGTVSPTCTTVHRGCCSRHGGVCQ